MKRGDIIGIGSGKQVSLLCSIEEANGDELKLFVINGCWQLFFDTKSGEAAWSAPGGKVTRTELAILYVGPIRGRDYGEQMDFIDMMLARNRLSRKLYVARLEFEDFIKTFRKRFAKSCKAFGDAWHGRAAYDDTIPF